MEVNERKIELTVLDSTTWNRYIAPDGESWSVRNVKGLFILITLRPCVVVPNRFPTVGQIIKFNFLVEIIVFYYITTFISVTLV